NLEPWLLSSVIFAVFRLMGFGRPTFDAIAFKFVGYLVTVRYPVLPIAVDARHWGLHKT
ncbi:1747_t:CDS:1, partial [Rhizophagus irregularis]